MMTNEATDGARRVRMATVRRILDAHGIAWLAIPHGRTMAEGRFSVGPSDWVDVTDWTPAMLREWLGY